MPQDVEPSACVDRRAICDWLESTADSRYRFSTMTSHHIHNDWVEIIGINVVRSFEKKKKMIGILRFYDFNGYTWAICFVLFLFVRFLLPLYTFSSSSSSSAWCCFYFLSLFDSGVVGTLCQNEDNRQDRSGKHYRPKHIHITANAQKIVVQKQVV